MMYRVPRLCDGRMFVGSKFGRGQNESVLLSPRLRLAWSGKVSKADGEIWRLCCIRMNGVLTHLESTEAQHYGSFTIWGLFNDSLYMAVGTKTNDHEPMDPGVIIQLHDLRSSFRIPGSVLPMPRITQDRGGAGDVIRLQKAYLTVDRGVNMYWLTSTQ